MTNMKNKKNSKVEQWVTGVKPSGLSVVDSFLWESNAIEDEWSEEAFEDAKKAWGYMSKQKKFYPDVVRETHRILMQRVWPEIAGEWRSEDVFIGGQRKRFQSHARFDHEILHLGVKMRTSVPELNIDKDVFSKKYHVAYEDVHPFRDGNGRTGRIFYNWHRLQLGLPIHVIHHGAEQQEYYNWFRQVWD